MARTKGFKDNVVALHEKCNLEAATPIEDIKYEEVYLGDYDGELPELPLGFFIPNAEGILERLTTYTFKSDLQDSGAYEVRLEKLEEQAQAGREIKGHVKKIASFLNDTIETIGGYPLGDVIKRYGNSAMQLFSNAYTADVFTMFLGARSIISGRELAVVTECPCPRSTTVKDDPEQGRPLHSLDELKIKAIPNLTDKPLFIIELPNGFNDGAGLVRKIYIEPLKLYQFSKITDKSGNQTMKTKMLTETIAAIPESNVYGQTRGRPFCEDIFSMMGNEDRRFLEKSIAKLSPGPTNVIPVQCSNCFEAKTFNFQVPWLTSTSYFLYTSSEPVPDDD